MKNIIYTFYNNLGKPIGHLHSDMCFTVENGYNIDELSNNVLCFMAENYNNLVFNTKKMNILALSAIRTLMASDKWLELPNDIRVNFMAVDKLARKLYE